MRFRRPSKVEAAINMAPLVDMVFLLLIFFAVSTTFLETAGLQLELPESSSTAERKVEDLTVFLAPDGKLTFDGAEVTREELARRLHEALQQSERKIVVLQADTHAEHGAVVKIMDLIRQAGAESLTVAARGAEGG